MCCTSITKYKTFSRFNVLKYCRVSAVREDGDRFTFNSLFIVVLMYLVVPLYSHATKSTPIPPQTPKITLTLFDPYLRTKPNYPLPKLLPKKHNKTPQSHTISPYTLSNYPTPPKP